jgi:hypothetical protein
MSFATSTMSAGLSLSASGDSGEIDAKRARSSAPKVRPKAGSGAGKAKMRAAAARGGHKALNFNAGFFIFMPGFSFSKRFFISRRAFLFQSGFSNSQGWLLVSKASFPIFKAAFATPSQDWPSHGDSRRSRAL